MPKTVRERFNLKPGDKLDVVVEDERIVLIPATLHVGDLSDLLPRPKKVVSVEAMDRAIRKKASERA